jgi:hypothetical protein
MVITLEPELEKALVEMAQRQGVAPEILVLRAIRDRLKGPVLPDEPRDEWERQLSQVATDCRASLTDSFFSSEGLYE